MNTTAVLEMRFGGMPAELLEGITDAIMVALDAHPLTIGPMVAADKSKGEVALSFEFAAVGDLNQDMARALGILGEALPPSPGVAANETIDVEGTAVGWDARTVRKAELVYA
jgi:hypothetical protein